MAPSTLLCAATHSAINIVKSDGRLVTVEAFTANLTAAVHLTSLSPKVSLQAGSCACFSEQAELSYFFWVSRALSCYW